LEGSGGVQTLAVAAAVWPAVMFHFGLGRVEVSPLLKVLISLLFTFILCLWLGGKAIIEEVFGIFGLDRAVELTALWAVVLVISVAFIDKLARNRSLGRM